MKETADKYFMSGFSCSEAVVASAIDKGLVPKELLSCASPFSGGMGVRCLCGAVAGAMLVIGSIYGKTQDNDGMQSRKLAKLFNEEFAKIHNVNCCKVLSAGFKDFHSPERKNHCRKMVSDACEILDTILKENYVLR